MSMMTHDQKSQEALTKLLDKLQIKSALDVVHLFRALRFADMMMNAYGQPDKLYMDPSSFNALSGLLSMPDPELVEEDK